MGLTRIMTPMRLPPLFTIAALTCLALTGLPATGKGALAARPQARAHPAASDQDPATAPAPGGQASFAIVRVVNGDIITRGDIENRARLFAVSTGLPLSPDVVERLRPQILRQLTDERLRQQEIARRKIVVSDEDVAKALAEIEQRNNLPPGGLRARLEAVGVSPRTLIDQIRTQLGWTRVLRDVLADRGNISDTEIAEQERLLKAQTGQTEYRLGEIFLSNEDPSKQAETSAFADTVISQLRAGAPFPVIAAQFSQSQTALEGGDLGWVQPNQVDPQVADILKDMPAGAISNPIHVAGGIDIVQMRGKRTNGQETANVASVRQAFFPFASALNPRAPTDQQKQALAAAQGVSRSAHDCGAVEAANQAQGGKRPSDPGEVRLDAINPQMRALLTSMPIGQPSKPLVSPDGIIVMMVCSRDQKTVGTASRDEIANQLLHERIELAARQLQKDLNRRAVIDTRGG